MLKSEGIEIEGACHKFFKKFLAHDREYFNISFEDACKEIDNFTKELLAPPQNSVDKPEISTREKLEWLKFLIENCTDLKLRDEIIQTAFKILTE